MPRHVIIGRLVQWYWPGWLNRLTLARVERARPREFLAEHFRATDPGYDLGRIRFLLDQLRSGVTLDPIHVDMTWHLWGPSGVVVLDGHHRLVAAVLARKRRIAADFGGLVEMGRWLAGEQRRCPL